jgi:hypothetical protein
VHPDSTGTETLELGILPDLVLYTSSSGCSFIFFMVKW